MDIDRYAITGPLGTGAGGTVYAAWDRGARREVALRLMPASELAERYAEHTFKEHCHASLSVRHRCIAPIAAVFELGDLAWPGGADASSVVVVTPRIYGMTLDDVLAVRPVLAPPELAFMLAELAGALSALHRAGLAHGDVSPRNVIVEPGGTLKLVDWFGGGRGERGTPGFRAPEVEAGSHGTGPVSGPADAAALARLIVHCAGGQGLFAAEIARVLSPWLGNDLGQERLGLAEIGARASEISAGREPLTTGAAPELAGEAIRRAALAAPTEPGELPAGAKKAGWWRGRLRRPVRQGVAVAAGLAVVIATFYTLRILPGSIPNPHSRAGSVSAALGKDGISPHASGDGHGRPDPGQAGADAGAPGGSTGNSRATPTALSPGGRGEDCEVFSVLSAQRDAAIEHADTQGISVIYMADSPGLRADLAVAERISRSGVEVGGIKTELTNCVELGGGLIEVESRQAPYRWREAGGEWRQEAAGELLKLRVQLRDGKVESVSQVGR